MKAFDADMAGAGSLSEVEEAAMQTLPSKPRGLVAFARWAWQSWATRSLAMGAIATAIDVLILIACIRWFSMSNPVAAMVGVLFGSTFTFFANKYFAFRDHNPALAPQAAKFVLATAIGMLAHAGFVYVFADRLGVQVVLAKFAADILVFTVGQMLVLRYFIFPVKKVEPVAAEPEPQPELGAR